MSKRFILDLTHEDRDDLEQHRRRNGLRSLAEAVRHLISTRSDCVRRDIEKAKSEAAPYVEAISRAKTALEIQGHVAGSGVIRPTPGALKRPNLAKPGALLKKR